ncbi:MAG TPA: hypothetical protein VJ205_03730 [Gammaproteobacteria bacterium]|nr:hypothetical protein [Gammaproteobacteria bacterium]
MNITVRDYNPKDHNTVVELITTIQQNEFGLPITYIVDFNRSQSDGHLFDFEHSN